MEIHLLSVKTKPTFSENLKLKKCASSYERQKSINNIQKMDLHSRAAFKGKPKKERNSLFVL